MKSKFNIPARVSVFALLVLVGLIGLFALTAAQSAGAQEDSTTTTTNTIEYAENGQDPVATFTAMDPEGITSITWAVLADDAAFTDIEGVADADAADAADFTIDKDGMLRFVIGDPPDFENPMGSNSDNAACDIAATPNPCTNTYKVVVSATDSGKTGYKKVTVMVTNVAEKGEVTWTTDANADSTVDDPRLMQFQAGTLLSASVTDGDIGGPDKAVANPTWRWHSSPDRISMGTMIDGENSATHIVTTADVGMYLRAEAYYVVTGNIDQETASLTSDHPVLAVRAGNNQLKFDPDTASREVPEGMKGMKAGAPVTATGNHGAVNYTLTGDDAGKFRIDQRTGQITTMVDLDFDETDTRKADQCANRNSCVVAVRATDASGDATAASAGANIFPDATVTIELTDVNEKPEFVSDYNAVSPMTITRTEGMTALADNDAAVTYTATDPEDRNITYRLMGPDGANFSLSSDRVLSFKQKPDFEKPMDTDRNNIYEVTVQASDGTLHEDRMVKVTVTNADEAPAVSGPSSRNFKENGEDPVATFKATDPEGVTSITWSLPDVAPSTLPDGFAATDFTGSDADHFTIDRDGILRFAIGDDEDPPDFEAPRGAAFNAATNPNTYRVVVAASDQETGGMMGYHKVTVMVTNVAEKGEVTWTTDANADSTVDDPELMQFQAGTLLTASVTDGDIGGPDKAVADPAWRWYRRSVLISGEETNAYTVTTDDVGRHIRAEATYRVGDSTTQETASLTSSHPVLAIRAGNNQLKFDPVTASREVPEGKKGANVGAPVKATDNHGAVNYTITGDDADKFRIDQRTGQITTDVDLDFDAADDALPDNCRDENGCSVTVRANDASGDASAANATVTIRLTDVNEKPEFVSDSNAASPTTITRAEGMTSLADNDADVTYTAIDPEKLNVNLSLMGPDRDNFSLSSDRVLSFKQKPDFEMPTDRDRDNVYEVTVRASDSTLHEDRMVRVTVTNADDAPVITGVGLEIHGLSSVSLAEGSTTTALSYTASGSMSDIARWTLEGSDARYFRVGSTEGAMTELMFRSAPDYEMPRGMAMSGTNQNTYMVTLKANDGTYTDTHDVKVIVTNVEELGTLSGDASLSQAENVMEIFGPYTASGSMADMAAWTLMGDDAGEFMLEGARGMNRMLKFRSTPDFEMPRGMAMSDTNRNTYMVTVKAKAGGETAMKDVTVAVTNVDEDGTITLSSMTPVVGATMTADLTDPDSPDGVTGATWQWSRSTTKDGSFENIDSVTTSYTPVEADGGNHLMVRAMYTDGHGSGKNAMATTDEMVRNLAISGMSSIDYPEKETDDVGAYTVTGASTAPATWALEGADASDFTITGGTLRFMISPDYEMPTDEDTNNTYMVTIRAEADSRTAVKEVTVTVTNVEELGMLSGPAAPSYMENGTEAVGTYTADGPMAAAWSLEGSDDDLMLSADGMLTFKSSPDYEMPTDEDTDNMYQVTVKAGAGSEMDMIEVTITVTNADEDGMVTLSMTHPVVDTAITAILSDPDGMITGTTWQWSRSMTMDGTFTDITGATTMSYTPMPADVDHYLRATVMYADGHGSGKTMMKATDTVTRAEATDPVSLFDADRDGAISPMEVHAAIDDFLSDNPTLDPAGMKAIIDKFLE